MLMLSMFGDHLYIYAAVELKTQYDQGIKKGLGLFMALASGESNANAWSKIMLFLCLPPIASVSTAGFVLTWIWVVTSYTVSPGPPTVYFP